MCVVQKIQPANQVEVINIGEVRVAGLAGAVVPFTRTEKEKFQCQHENGEWEDLPEIQDGEEVYCEPNTKIRLVPL